MTVNNDTDILSSLSIGDFLEPQEVSDYYNSENNLNNLKRQEEYYGADEIQPMAVEVNIEGKEYLFCPNTVRYGEKWYILDLNGMLAIILGGNSYSCGFAEK